VLAPLAQAGYAVTGVDLSEAMLECARAKLAQLALGAAPPRLIRGDMRDVVVDQPPRCFPLAIIALNSLMHLPTQEDQRRVLARAGAHLLPTGRLVVDLFNPDAVVDEAKDGHLFLHCLRLRPETGSHLLHFQSPRTDRAAQTIRMQNYYDEIASDGSVRRTLAPFRLRYVTRAELDLLVPAAGLQLDAVYGDYDLGPFTAESPRLLIVARRAGGQ
jgi:SAM-dependent methyltransferase